MSADNPQGGAPKAECGARKKSGGRCTKPPLPGKTRCRWHGGVGNDPGPGHVNYKHGRYSKAFGRFAQAVEEAIQDPELLDARRGIAGALAALEEAGTRVEENDTPAFRRAARELYREARELLPTNAEAGLEKLRELGRLLDRGVAADIAFRDVVARSETYRQAVNDALWLKLKASTSMGVSDLVLALDGLVTIVLEVAGPEVAREVAARFDRARLGGRLERAGFRLGARAEAEAVQAPGAP